MVGSKPCPKTLNSGASEWQTNTVADHDMATIVAVKSFIVQDPTINLKHF
jgi:hypothetical protein